MSPFALQKLRFFRGAKDDNFKPSAIRLSSLISRGRLRGQVQKKAVTLTLQCSPVLCWPDLAAAIDAENLAGHEGTEWSGEEFDDAGDFIDHADAVQRSVRD